MKLVQLFFAFLIFPVLLSSDIKHEYYVSVTKIEYSEKDKSLQIITQIFIDDFEKLLRQRYDETITLTEEDESTMVNTYMKRYLADKLNVKVNGTAASFKFIGKEYKDGITYCYLEIEDVLNINSIKVTNQTLFDVFPEQQNIVRLKLKNKNKSFLLLPAKDTCVLNFD